MKQYFREINLSVLMLLLILSAGFTILCFFTSANYHHFDYYILFYGIALILSLICAIKIRKICKPIWILTLIWIIFLLHNFVFIRDLYLTPAFFIFYVIVLTVLWSYITYFSLFNPQKKYCLIGWLGIFIVLNLLTGWVAWFSGDNILSKKHAQNLLICREKTLQIVERIQEYQQTYGIFPQALDQMNLSSELTTLPATEFEYQAESNIYFSLGFDDILLTSIHWPERYEYEYVKIDSEPMRDGWEHDPLETIHTLDASIIPEHQKSKDY